MTCPAFKVFLAHVHKQNDVPKSDADDKGCYALCLHTGAFVSDADEEDAGRPTHAHTEGTCTSFRTQKYRPTGG